MLQKFIILLIIGATLCLADETGKEIEKPLPTELPPTTDPSVKCNRVCDPNIIQRINARDLLTNCYVCFQNDCLFVKALCQYPGRKYFQCI